MEVASTVWNSQLLAGRVITRPSVFFTADQVRAILVVVEGWHRVMLAIAAMTGLRIGEILALKVSDFDFERKLLTVHRSVWRGKLSTPKTSTSQAILPLPNALARIVGEHIAMLKSEWLFVNTRGGFLTSENVVRQVLVPILDKLGLPRCGFHDFRHTRATLLLYSHVQAESRRAVVEKGRLDSGPRRT